MSFFGLIAAIVLFLHWPIPLYWFVVHPYVGFWRSHEKTGYVTGLLFSYLPVTLGIVLFRHELFRPDRPPLWRVLAGLTLLIFEGWIFWRVKRDLGTARLVGKTEIAGGGEIARDGIYANIRHPRYVGSFLAILGACLLAGTPAMWVSTGVWLLLIRLAIALEERELHARFGTLYEEYCGRVPRFLPLRMEPHDG
jgi:protein-S-isoprenylcysteine O-methyltransferase Ste14